MKIHSPAVWGLLACALALSMTAPAAAQDNPPGRTAQLSEVSGSVWLEPAGTQKWIAAQVNRPVTVGDKIWADRDSRAELDIGDAAIRLWSMTGVSFLNLDQLTAQMQVTAGQVIVHVRDLADGEQDEIDTPNLALSLEQPGIYRVEVNGSGDTTIVEVVEGQALASGGGRTYTVGAQQRVAFTGTTSLVAHYGLLGSPDAFDDWSMARDREEAKAAASVDQYVSPDVVGAQALAGYGTWQNTQWGYAWFPVVPTGWAPYSLGYWTWIFPWGWTWVDDEPWGFAPFHYGRWGWWQGNWCWVPGPRRIRPVYAPALVAFTRDRIGRGGLRAGQRRDHPVGWLPLGPRDVYMPSYAASSAYVHRVNLANTGAVTSTAINDRYHGHPRRAPYANSKVPGAITAVSRSVFTGSQSVGTHRIVLPRRGALSARFTTAAPAIAPVKASVLGPHGSRTFSPPRRLIDRPVVARLAPSRAPVSFEAQRVAIRANGGHPLNLTQWAHLRPNRPAGTVRLAGSSVREAPAVSHAAAPSPQRRLPNERPGVRGARMTSSRTGPGSAASVVKAPHRPVPRRPGVRRDRPPWLQGNANRSPAAGHRTSPHMPRVEGVRRGRVSGFQSPQNSFSVPGHGGSPRTGRPPRFEMPARMPNSSPRVVPHVSSYHASPPPRAAPHAPSHHRGPAASRAPRNHFSRPSPEVRHPFAFQAPSASSAGARDWSAPPMYRAQRSPPQSASGALRGQDHAYAPPATPPPMYRPVGGSEAAAAHEHFSAPRMAAPRSATPHPVMRSPAGHAMFRR